jgi:hypothetical protein
MTKLLCDSSGTWLFLTQLYSQMVEWAMVEVVRVPIGVCSEGHDESPLVGKESNEY